MFVYAFFSLCVCLSHSLSLFLFSPTDVSADQRHARPLAVSERWSAEYKVGGFCFSSHFDSRRQSRQLGANTQATTSPETGTVPTQLSFSPSLSPSPSPPPPVLLCIVWNRKCFFFLVFVLPAHRGLALMRRAHSRRLTLSPSRVQPRLTDGDTRVASACWYKGSPALAS